MILEKLGRFQIRHLYPVVPLAAFFAWAAQPIQDNSFLWHVRAGSLQLELASVLTSDPFSYTAGGAPWRTQSWLAELFYAYLEAVFGGIGWATVFVGIVGVGTLGITGLLIYRNAGTTVGTVLWLFVATWLLLPFGQPRPVILSYLLLALLAVAVAEPERLSWTVVPITWIWAGVHGSWIIGLALVMLVAITRRSFRIAAIGVLAGVVTAATAHGLGTWEILRSFTMNSDALEYMLEWRVPDFGSIVQGPYLIILGGLMVAAVKGKVSIRDLWIILPFALLGFMSQRTVPVAAIVLVPFAARSTQFVLAMGRRGRAFVPWTVMASIILAVAIVSARPHALLDGGRFPSEEAIAAASVGPGRFFHDTAVGGYLIYRDDPGQLVYIDDRAELYGASMLAEFDAARNGDYRRLFRRLGMSAAIVPTDWRLSTRLREDGWAVVHSDESFEVLIAGRTTE